MNCDQFAQLIGMRCEPQPMQDGSSCLAVVTPFSFFDGDGLSLFARTVGDQVHLFDDGQTLFWLHGLGHRGLDDRRSWRPLRSALERYSVVLSDDATIEVMAPLAQAAGAFARMVSGMLAVDAWARDAAGAESSPLLDDEAALYLRAWRPDSEVVQHPEPLVGISGQAHSFSMLQAGEYIDTIGPSRAASGAELRKLVDLRSSATHPELDVRVIVDDRKQPERAMQEIVILGRVARAWPMSQLIAAAGGTSMPAQ